VDAFFSALAISIISTPGTSKMGQSSTASFFLNCVPAAAVGLMLMPPVTAAAATPEPNSTEQVEASPSEVKVNDPVESGSGGTNHCVGADQCSAIPNISSDRAYLIKTATPGGTMMRQGPDVSIGRLHPEFVTRLAAAIREARVSGLSDAGLFSAYRPPAFGVGGFKNKFSSLHSYGLAVDMHGIGRPGSAQAQLWTRIAAKHGVACPYGVNNPAEWNHCQPTRIKMVRSDSPLVKTIAPQGPTNPLNMFEAGKELIESVAKLFASFGGDSGTVQKSDKSIRLASRGRRVRMADAQSARAHRQDRHVAHKLDRAKRVKVASAVKRVKVVAAANRVKVAAAAGGDRGTRQAAHRHGGRRERS
jgi:hypothetical protein